MLGRSQTCFSFLQGTGNIICLPVDPEHTLGCSSTGKSAGRTPVCGGGGQGGDRGTRLRSTDVPVGGCAAGKAVRLYLHPRGTCLRQGDVTWAAANPRHPSASTSGTRRTRGVRPHGLVLLPRECDLPTGVPGTRLAPGPLGPLRHLSLTLLSRS